ncbi:MAG: hypothetical protein IJU86_04130 [Firmicutes bacterium]|nr:hypothetical protein [Bacillota bacterium]
MNDSGVNNKKDDDIDNFTLLAKYIRYQMLQANDDKIINELNNIDFASLGFDEDDKALDSKKIIVENDEFNSNSNTIKEEIDKVKTLSSDKLKTDLKEFMQDKFLGGISGEFFPAQKFNEIKNIGYQFALIEYALKSGQNPMKLFDINLDWMVGKLKTNKIKLNRKEIELQNKNEGNGLFFPEFYLKCELVFNLFCLYSEENLFNLFSAEEIIRQFGVCADQFVKFCYNKKCSKEKNGSEILLNQLNKEFESIDKENRRIGGFFGFLCSLIIIAIMTNIVAILSPWVLIVIPLGTLTGWLIGQVTALKSQNKILNLLDLKNSKENILLMQQTFEAFKKQYESFEPIPPGGSAINESNVQPEQAKLNASEKKIDDDVRSQFSDSSRFDVRDYGK